VVTRGFAVLLAVPGLRGYALPADSAAIRFLKLTHFMYDFYLFLCMYVFMKTGNHESHGN